MNFNIGDEVSFLNEPGGGKITFFRDKLTALVLSTDGMEIPYPLAQLVARSRQHEKQPEPLPAIKHEEFINEIKKIPLEKVIREKEKPREQKISKARIVLEGEVDLHIECLLPSHRGMSNAEIIQVQLSHFSKALDNAVRNNYYKIVFIHGVGKGRLKEEIHAILKNYKGVTYRAASYERYGWGATEVLIR